MRARFAASIALAAGVALGTAGCGFVTPIATLDDYAPSDGTQTTIGDVKILNALIVSNDGDTGNLVASVFNNGDSRATVKVQFEGDSGTVDTSFSVGAGEQLSLGTEDPFLLEGIGTDPGALLPVFLQHGSVSGQELLVPVLDGTLPEYEPLVP